MIKLYTAYNDILINLLDKFFESKKAHCKDTIDAYRKFLTRQEGVQQFLQLAEVRKGRGGWGERERKREGEEKEGRGGGGGGWRGGERVGGVCTAIIICMMCINRKYMHDRDIVRNIIGSWSG